MLLERNVETFLVVFISNAIWLHCCIAHIDLPEEVWIDIKWAWVPPVGVGCMVDDSGHPHASGVFIPPSLMGSNQFRSYNL